MNIFLIFLKSKFYIIFGLPLYDAHVENFVFFFNNLGSSDQIYTPF